MKKTNKIFALLLALTMIFTCIPSMQLFALTEASETAIYVSADGVDSGNYGTSPENPVATINRALQVLVNRYPSSPNWVIYVSGEVEIPSDGGYNLYGGGNKYNKNVTIRGAGTGAKITIDQATLRFNGPTAFENITLNFKRLTNMHALSNEFLFGKNVSVTYPTGNLPVFYTGDTDTVASNTNSYSMTLNSGSNFDLMIGNNINSGAQTVNGAYVKLDGATPRMVRIKNYNQGSYTYTKNLDFVMNSGRITHSLLLSNGFATLNFSQGAYLQCIFNNNTITNVANGRDILSSSSFDINKLTDKTYWIESAMASDGSTLEPTETAGTYRVTGGMKAVARDSSNNIYESSDGVLTVGDAGIYTVTWQTEVNDYDAVYVSAHGNDNTGRGTNENPYATISKAVEILNSSTAETAKIVIKDSADCPSAISKVEGKKLIITGQSGAVLNIKGDTDLFSSVEFENITLDYYAASQTVINARGNELGFGNNVIIKWQGQAVEKNDIRISTGRKWGGLQYTGRHKLTINSGGGYTVYLGDSTNSSAAIVPGVDFVLNGGDYKFIKVGGDGIDGAHSFTGDVNLTFNGGTASGVVLGNGLNFNNNAVQIIYNNGIGKHNRYVIAQNIADRNGHYYELNCEAIAGCSLNVTETAGTYAVLGEKIAIATNVNDPTDVCVSENDLLTVSGPASYNVTFVDAVTYLNKGDTIEVVADTTIDLTNEKAMAKENQLFVGWVVNNTAPSSNIFSAGTVITAKYIDYTPNSDLKVNSAQIKKVDINIDNGVLRFTSEVNDTFIASLNANATNVTNGILGMGAYELGQYDLTTDTIGAASSKSATLDMDVPNDALVKTYIARAYITFTDLNGAERVVYTDHKTDSVVLVAKRIAEKYPDEASYFEDIINKAKNDYLSATDITTDNDSKLKNPTIAAETYDRFYKLNNGLVVRELNIEVNNDGNVIEIVDTTDLHISMLNETDILENNPVVMSTYANRIWRRDGESIPNAVKAMEYASLFDQTVVTGDVLDYLTYGALDLTKRAIWGVDKDAMITLGNHDFERQNQGTITDPSPIETRYDLLQQNWNHDIFYTSKILGDKVMIIQMHNGNKEFTDEQFNLLSDDIETAKQEGYAVLLFMHIPLKPAGLASDSPYRSSFYDSGYQNYALADSDCIDSSKNQSTQNVYNLILDNQETIKGIFTGHEHSDYYLPIAANNGKIIPQYIIGGNTYDNGHVLKINVN